MNGLKDLPNIGSEVERKLNMAGINTIEQLKEAGAINAFMRIRAFDNSACINMLMGLEGAIEGIRWHNLSPAKKQELKNLFASIKNK